MRLTDAAAPDTILRIVQSVHGQKAEPIKLWLAKGGYESIDEIENLSPFHLTPGRAFMF